MVELTQADMRYFEMAYRVFDDDGDGTVTVKEISRVAYALGHKLTEDEIQDKINEIDLDGNGTVELEEFVSLMMDKMKEKNDEELRAAFRCYASDNPNFITHDSLRHVFTVLGQQLSDDEIDEMMREADRDGDGVISYEDFVDVMTTK